MVSRTKDDTFAEFVEVERERILLAVRRAKQAGERARDVRAEDLRASLGIPGVTPETGTGFAPGFPSRLKEALPFYERVIAPVYPVGLNREFFERMYGLSMEDFLHLVRRGRVTPIVLGAAKDLNGNEYARELVELKPITLGVLEMLFVLDPLTAMETAMWNEMSERMELLGRVDGVSPALRKIGYGPSDLANAYYSNAFQLSALGYRKLVVDGPRITGDLWSYWGMLQVMAFFRARPHFDGMGASPIITQQQFDFGRRTGLPLKQDIVFPFEAANFLTRYYRIPLPGDLPLSTADAMYGAYSFKKARELLVKLDSSVRSKPPEAGVPLADDVARAFREACLELPEIEASVKRARWKVSSLGFAVTAAIGTAVAGLPGLLASVGYATAEARISERVAPVVARVKVSPLASAVWRFEEAHETFEAMASREARVQAATTAQAANSGSSIEGRTS